MGLALNPLLDVAELTARYRSAGRIQIREFLETKSAEAMLDELHGLPWGMAYNDGPRTIELNAALVAQLDDRQAQQIMAGIRARAREQYQFLYSYYPLLSAYFTPGIARRTIFDFYEFINSDAVLDLVRTITGLDRIRWADGQATWFKPGHFLKAHTDKVPAEGRLAAYVMNFTTDWDRDWGGFLQFFDGRGDIEQAIKPAFNALNIFTIPVLHSVSMVSTYVTSKRLAVTGWFRGDDPPGAIGAAT